jgi:hypothetical protein
MFQVLQAMKTEKVEVQRLQLVTSASPDIQSLRKLLLGFVGIVSKMIFIPPQVTVMESLVYSAWLRLAAEIDSTQRMVQALGMIME